MERAWVFSPLGRQPPPPPLPQRNSEGPVGPAPLERRTLHVSSRYRRWPEHRNANSFSVDLAEPIKNVRKVVVRDCVLPNKTATPGVWQDAYAYAVVVFQGLRLDVCQTREMPPFPSNAQAVLPLEADSFYTFYHASDDAGLWDHGCLGPTEPLSRLDISLAAVNPKTSAYEPYPFADDSFLFSENWSATLDIYFQRS